MADPADRAQLDIEMHTSAMQTNYELAKGEEGICVECDLPSLRLIDKKCAACRTEIEKRKNHGFRG